MDEASELFARTAQRTTDVRLLDVVQEFFEARGEHGTAQSVLDKRLALTRDRRLAARLYAAVMPDFVEDLIQNAAPQLAPEDREDFAAMSREIFDSAEWKEQVVRDMAEHFTVWELRTMTRFYGGEGKSITQKMGRFMGDAIPRAVEMTAPILQRRGLSAR